MRGVAVLGRETMGVWFEEVGMRRQLVVFGAWLGTATVLGVVVWVAIDSASASILSRNDYAATADPGRFVVDGKRRQLTTQDDTPTITATPMQEDDRPAIGSETGGSVVDSGLDASTGQSEQPVPSVEVTDESTIAVAEDGRIRGFQIGGYGQISLKCEFWKVISSAITPNPGWSVVRQDVVSNRRLNATLSYEDGTRIFILAQCPNGVPRFDVTVAP